MTSFSVWLQECTEWHGDHIHSVIFRQLLLEVEINDDWKLTSSFENGDSTCDFDPQTN
jgi:hypothetical protein